MDCLTHLLTCPVCHLRFSRVGSSLKCVNGHSFDVAKEGYVNLAVGKMPGDTKEMLLARREFLERGYYRPLSAALNDIVADYVQTQAQVAGVLPHFMMLDAGCGEGYYLGQMQQYLAQQFPQMEYCAVGLDVSKDAMRMAAKRYKQLSWVVANVKERLVFANDALHMLLNIFAPRNVDEFARIVMLGGIVLVVIPGPSHLHGLRSVLHLLDIEEQKEQKVIEQFSERFALLTSKTITYNIALHKEEIALAVLMTPNGWHMSNELRQRMGNIEELETEVSFTCLVFERVRVS